MAVTTYPRTSCAGRFRLRLEEVIGGHHILIQGARELSATFPHVTDQILVLTVEPAPEALLERQSTPATLTRRHTTR